VFAFFAAETSRRTKRASQTRFLGRFSRNAAGYHDVVI
jgi:hypothetical protein